MVQINLNNEIKIEVLPSGLTFLKERFITLQLDKFMTYDEYCKHCLHMSDEKYITVPIWELMNLFGSQMTMGNTRPPIVMTAELVNR